MIKYGQLEKNDNYRFEEIYLHLGKYVTDYPTIFNWFYTKVIPEINKTRFVIVAIDEETDQLVGFVIMKNNKERKLCSLYVIPKYRGKGIGKALLEKGLAVIKMRKPLATVNNKVLDYYLPLFTKFGFSLRYMYRDYYAKDLVEYCFNGSLPERKLVTVSVLR